MPARFPNKRGYILVESIIAVTIVVIGLLGIFSLLSRSLSLNRVVADRFVAAYLAAEGIELAKNAVDNNVLAGKPWNAGLAAGAYEADAREGHITPATGRALRFTPATGAYGYAEAEPTRMKRTIAIRPARDGESLAIGSRVDWVSRGGGTFSVYLEEHLFHWR
jgi:Tfp pilus assembly protein PilV